MKIKVIAPFYREELLVPHFLNHYAFADTIIALVGSSPDRTEELLKADPRVRYVPLEMPLGIDDILRMQVIDKILNAPDDEHAWTIVVDSDEFVWPASKLSQFARSYEWAHEYLEGVPVSDNVLMANMWQVYRHTQDTDLDPTQTPALQRRHGIIDRDSGGREGYRKPIVIRTNSGIHLGAGNHRIDGGPAHISTNFSYNGAHWAMADPALVLRRIRDRRDRMSPTNKAGRLGSHLFDVTPEGLLAEMKSHENDPILF